MVGKVDHNHASLSVNSEVRWHTQRGDVAHAVSKRNDPGWTRVGKQAVARKRRYHWAYPHASNQAFGTTKT